MEDDIKRGIITGVLMALTIVGVTFALFYRG